MTDPEPATPAIDLTQLTDDQLDDLFARMLTLREPPAAAQRPPANVIEALCRVMSDLPAIGKDQQSEQNYRYRGIEAITAHAQRLFGRYGVVFVPRVVDRQVREFTINNRPWTEDRLTVVYTVYGPGGTEDRIEVGPLVALGRDNSDKGTNKCMTQAFKYALLQVLCIGDKADDADQDTAREADYTDAQRAAMEAQRAANQAALDARAIELGWADAVTMARYHDDLLARFKAGGAITAAIGADQAKALWARCPARPMSRDDYELFTSEVEHELTGGAPFDTPAEAKARPQAAPPAQTPQEAPAGSDAPAPTPDPEGAQNEQEASDQATLAEAVAAFVKGLSKREVVTMLGQRRQAGTGEPLSTAGNLQTLGLRLATALLGEGWAPPGYQPAVAPDPDSPAAAATEEPGELVLPEQAADPQD